MDRQCGWGREQETTWNRLRNLTLISRVIRELLSREMWSDPFENDQVAAKGRAGGRESDAQEILEPCISNPPSHPFLLPWPHSGLCTAFTQPYPAPSWTCSVRSCPENHLLCLWWQSSRQKPGFDRIPRRTGCGHLLTAQCTD